MKLKMNLQQLKLNMIYQILGFLINSIVTFYLTTYIVDKIGAEANGFVGLANNFIQYMQVITVALNSMLIRTISVHMNKNETKKASEYFSSAITANIILSCVLAIIFGALLFNLEKVINVPVSLISDVKLLWIFVFINFVIEIFASICSVGTFINNRLDISALINIKGYILRIIVLAICYNYGKTATWYVGFASAVMSVYLLIANRAKLKELSPKIKYNIKFSKTKYVIELLKSGVWKSFSRLSAILSTGLDLLIANTFISVAAMGKLSIANTIPTILGSLFGVLAEVFAPSFTKNVAKNNYEELKKETIFSIKILTIFSTILMTILIVFGKDIYALWLPAEDINLLQGLTIAIALSYVVCFPLEPLFPIYTATDKIKVSSIVLVGCSLANILIVIPALKISNNEILSLYIVAGVSSIIKIVRILTFHPIHGAHCINQKWNTFYPEIFSNILIFTCISLIAIQIRKVIPASNIFLLLLDICIVTLIGLLINYIINFRNFKNRKK